MHRNTPDHPNRFNVKKRENQQPRTAHMVVDVLRTWKELQAESVSLLRPKALTHRHAPAVQQGAGKHTRTKTIPNGRGRSSSEQTETACVTPLRGNVDIGHLLIPLTGFVNSLTRGMKATDEVVVEDGIVEISTHGVKGCAPGGLFL